LIQKKFDLYNDATIERFKALIDEMPLEYIKISEDIINEAKLTLGKKINDNIYISLMDHIKFSIERYNKGIFIKNLLLWEIKRLYMEEFEISKIAIAKINKKFNVNLAEDEAGFIALHIVTAQIDQDMDSVVNMTKIMQEVCDIVKLHFGIEFIAESLSYFRFITHLKFFAQRVISKKLYKDSGDDELYNVIKKNYPNSFKCVKKIDAYIKQCFQYDLTNDEILYLTVHVERIIAN
jgi:beta-glucoside operon transcriptional antiterminator